MSNDRTDPERGERAPRLAAAMDDVRAASVGGGQGSERARLGRIGGGRRARDDDADAGDPDGRRRT